MRFMEHIKFAVFLGVLTGIYFGAIDIISRIVVMSFEWFELYQSLLISISLVIPVFIVLTLAIELLKFVTKREVSKQTLFVFYASNALAFSLFFYTVAFLDTFIFPKPGASYLARVFSPILLPLIVIIYVFLMTKFRKSIASLAFSDKGRKVKAIANNLMMLVAVFIVSCLLTDLYLLNFVSGMMPGELLQGQPNVIVISMDTVRADHLGTYGYSLNTSPNIDGLAEEAVVFDNAVSVTSWTLPTHSSIFTGRYPVHHGANSEYEFLDNEETTVAEILREQGYVTAAVIGGPYCKAKYGIGQGFMHYDDRLDFFEYSQTFRSFSIRTVTTYIDSRLDRVLFHADGERSAEEVNQQVFDWLDNNKDHNFFLFIHYFDPHMPYTLGSEFREQFDVGNEDWWTLKTFTKNPRYEDVPEEKVNKISALYDAEIYYLDHQLGRLFDRLEELDLVNNTIIIITADHGEEFQEHGGFGHRVTLYEEVIHVPLIVYHPNLSSQRIEQRIGTTNLFPTILELLNIETPGNIDSTSLLPLMKNETGYERDYVFSELFGRPKYDEPMQRAISLGKWKLIEVEPEQEDIFSSLFNLEHDPQEQENLYDENIENRTQLQAKILDLT